jgi:hypothetical protein
MAGPGTAAAALDDRYGRSAGSSRSTRRRLTAVAALLVTVAVAFIAWVAVDQTDRPVSWSAGTFRAVDDGLGRLSFTVTAAPGTRVVCTVQALNGGLTVVGRVDVDAGPSADRSFSIVADVPTFERASGGNVQACAVRTG